MGKTYRSWQSRSGYKASKHEQAKRRRVAEQFKSHRDKGFRFDPREYR